jgi:hypothetical protein
MMNHGPRQDYVQATLPILGYPFFFGTSVRNIAPITKSVVRGGTDTGLHEVVSRHDTRPIQTTESRPPRGLAGQRGGSVLL